MLRVMFLFGAFSGSCSQEYLSVSGQNLTLNGEKVFLSGMNQAWHNYGSDFGHNFYLISRPYLLTTLDDIKKSGGNSISKCKLYISPSHPPIQHTFRTRIYNTVVRI